jgi:predicted exporter
MRRWVAFAALVIALAALAIGAAMRAAPSGAISTDIRGLLPQSVELPAVRAATQRFQDILERRQFVLLEGADEREVLNAAREMRRAVAESGLYSDDADERTGGLARDAAFLFPYRYGLLTPEQSRQLMEGEGGKGAAVEQALAAIYSPFAPFNAELLLHDPFLISVRLLPERVAHESLTVRNGFLTGKSAQGTAILMALHLLDSPFSTRTETSIATLTARIDGVLAAKYPGVRITRAGVIEHSYRTAATVKKEVGMISSLSTIGIVLMFVCAFRSVVPLLASLVTVAASIAGGLCAVIALEGSINLISLVAGTSLIGISVDYAFHYFAELRYGRAAGDKEAALAHIRPGLVLAFLTTVIAFVGMAVPPFPALRELAMFSGVGISIAFLTVWTVFPLFPTRQARTRLPGSAFFARWLALADGVDPRWALSGLLVGALASTGLVVALLEPVDDVRALQPSDAAVTAAEEHLAAFSGAPLAGQYLLVEGRDDAEVLAREEALRQTLDDLAADGQLGGYLALSQLVPSAASQRASLAAMSSLAQGDPAQGDPAPIDRLVATLGLDPKVGATFRADLANATLLRPSDVLDRGAFTELSQLWLGRVGAMTASVVALRTPVPAAALEAAARNHEGVHFVDAVASINDLMHHYRVRVEWMAGISYAAILGLLAIRYGTRGALLAVMPPVVAALAALVALMLAGQVYSVFATVGLILVLGIGVDYTLFFLESPGDARATALGVAMAFTSTLFAFGLLALSSTPAVSTFGVTISAGMTVAFVLAPLARAGRAATPRTTT